MSLSAIISTEFYRHLPVVSDVLTEDGTPVHLDPRPRIAMNAVLAGMAVVAVRMGWVMQREDEDDRVEPELERDDGAT
jgi:hypothetical protein